MKTKIENVKDKLTKGKKKFSSSHFFLLSFSLLTSHFSLLSAIEIPLEGLEKGTKLAYVNMHKIFEAFPETEKARAELTKLIDEKKSDITIKKEEIAQLKGEIEFLRKKMFAVEPSTISKTAITEKIEEKPETPKESQPQSVTALTLPEGSPMGFLFSPPEKSTQTAEETVISSETAQSQHIKVSTSAPPILPGIPSPEPQLKEKEALLSRREADLEAFIGATEEEIKQLEEGKTMTLMARIYKSLEEIALKDGYSVVLDKGNILYGENAVDITDNVIWRLTGKMKR